MSGDEAPAGGAEEHEARTAKKKQEAQAKPERVRRFVVFFKNYMSLSTLAVAALPIPVTASGLIPTYAAHTKLLSVYTPLFCFLLLGYCFYARHGLARTFFGRRARLRGVLALAPLMLIALSIVCAIGYSSRLEESVRIGAEYVPPGMFDNRDGQGSVLAHLVGFMVPSGTTLIGLYLGIFLFAEAAFILMALREYMQDTLGLTERELILDMGDPLDSEIKRGPQ